MKKHLFDICQFLLTILLLGLTLFLCVPMLAFFLLGAIFFMASVGLIAVLANDGEYVSEMTEVMLDLVLSPFNKGIEILSRGKNRGF